MSRASLAESLSDMRQVKANKAGQIPSLSGNERNPFFLNQQGEDFKNLSLISGADSEKDGRSMVLWDFNKDGFLDLAIVNANAPMFAIYENQLAKHLTKNKSIFIRFRGANHAAQAGAKKSNRDGYGCVVIATVDGKTLRSEHHCGVGFAAQNSALMHIGIGEVDKVENLTIRWPSGTLQMLEDIPAGSLVTCSEGGRPVITHYKTSQ